MQKHFLVLLGTRPEAIKLFPVINRLKARRIPHVKVCATAQHRQLLDQVLKLTNIVPDIDLDVMRANQTLDQLTARLLPNVGEVLDRVRPTRVIVQGDTTTAMAGALAAYYRRIPVSHVEAGLRSGDIYAPWPEEVNRKIIGTIADQHFAPTARGRGRAAGGERAGRADPRHRKHRGRRPDPRQGHGRFGPAPRLPLGQHQPHPRQPAPHPRHLPSSRELRRRRPRHRRCAADHPRARGRRNRACRCIPIRNVADVFAAHFSNHPRVELISPQDYTDFVGLLSLAYLVLTDSGGVQEEAPTFGKPVLVMRETTERPEGVEAGTARLVGADRDRIVGETFRLLDDDDPYAAMSRSHNPFGDGRASERIVKVLLDA